MTQKKKGGSAHSASRRSTKNEGTPTAAETVAVANAAETGNANGTATESTGAESSGTAERKPAMTTEQTVQHGVLRLVRDEIADRTEQKEINEKKKKLADILNKLQVTAPGMQEFLTPSVPTPVPVPSRRGRPVGSTNAAKATTATEGSKRGRKPGAAGSLLSQVQTFMYKNGYIDPKFATAKELNEFGQKQGFSSMPNLLSQQAKQGVFVKGPERGQYALPKKYKPE